MRTVVPFALAAAVCCLGGCRFKAYESFASATTPEASGQSSVTEKTLKQPYMNGGVADASGGLNPTTPYGRGAQPSGKALAGFDQPQKGSGHQPGEYPNVAAPGHAQTNAPAFQPSPSDVNGG